MHQHLNYRGPRRRREKVRVWENFWRDYSWKFPQHGKGNNQSSPRGTKSPIQNEPKEKHAKTHTNQTNKDKTQRKNIKSSKGEAPSNIQGKHHMLNSWSFSRTLQARREWQDIFKVLKGKNLQPRLQYSARISFKTDGEIKSFSDKQKLREFSTTKPALQQMLKGLL